MSMVLADGTTISNGSRSLMAVFANQNSPHSFLPLLLRSHVEEDTVIQQKLVETLATQPKIAAKFLEEILRFDGKIDPIIEWAPEIKKRLQESILLDLLLGVAWADQGLNDPALAQTNAAKTTGALKLNDSKFYENIILAIVAKNKRQFPEALARAKRAITINSHHAYAFIVLGRIYYDLNKINMALEQFSIAKKLSPKSAAIHTNIGALYFIKGSMDKARYYYTKSLALSPESCYARMGFALIEEYDRNYMNAINYLGKCLNDEKTRPLVINKIIELNLTVGNMRLAGNLARHLGPAGEDYLHTVMADIALQNNNTQEAEEHLKKIRNTTPQVAYLQAYIDYLRGDISKAIDNSESVIKQNPKALGAVVLNLVSRYYVTGKMDVDSMQSLVQDPSIGKLMAFLQGSYSAKMGDNINALAGWDKADNFIPLFSMRGISETQLNSKLLSLESKHLFMGIVLYLKHYHIAAIEEFKKGLKVYPDSPLGNFFMALSLMDTNQLSQASAHLVSATKNHSHYYSANSLLGDMTLKAGAYRKAMVYYKNALAVLPDEQLLIKLAWLYEVTQDFKAAEGIYLQYIQQYSDVYLGYFLLAQLKYHQQNYDQSLAMAHKAEVLAPENPQVNDLIGWVYYRKKNFAKALPYLNNASRQSGQQDAEILFHLGSTQYELGDDYNSKRNLLKALEASRNFEGVEQAQGLLKKFDHPAARRSSVRE